MSTIDGGNTWQIELLNDYYPSLNLYSIDVLENGHGWVAGLSNLLLVKSGISTGFNNLMPSTKTRIYPNPVKSNLFIESSKLISGVTIFDYLGNTIFRKIPNGKKRLTIDMRDLSSGIYFIRVDEEISKIIKH